MKYTFLGIVAAALLASAPVLAATAQSASPTPIKTPSVTFTGAEMDQMFNDLGSPTLYQKSRNGSLLPVIDPSVQKVMQMMLQKVRASMPKPAHAEKEPKPAHKNAAPSGGK